MNVLAITDIPRMTALFERLAEQHPGLSVVNDIHRGIEELETRVPAVVIIQNHLAGLSADILRKHLKSRLGHHKTRFALISTSPALDVETSAHFEVILDPALSDVLLEQAVQSLFRQPSGQKEKAQLQQETAPELSSREQEPAPPGPVPGPLLPEQYTAPITYELPRRPGISIISDFSKKLDSTEDTLQPEETMFAHHTHESGIRNLQREPDLITDFEEPPPWYRRTGTLLVIATLAAVVAVSLFQHRTDRTAAEKEPAPAASPPVATPVPLSPAADATNPTPPPPAARQPLTSHGKGRLRALPGFIPNEGHDLGYSREHPGWENYRGQTSEYRVFREKDGSIKAIQVIDRSGVGIQESFYISILKELSGAAAMRPTSSEIKEGYEIRRGELAGLQLVQYRDAQGGRMRGFVVTWP